jgi:hypothetical protein
MPAHDQAGVLQRIKQEFQGLGYVGSLLQQDYSYADILALDDKYAVRQIDLAAFAQEPPSYRTAAFGVTIANGRSGVDLVRDSRSLGAPQVLEINDAQVFRWKVTGKGDPILLEEMEPGGISNLFARNNDVWSPQQMLRVKATGQVATQLDFFDHDLMPLLDYEVRTKLDRLLRDTVTLATETFQKRFELKDEHYPPLFRLIFRLLTSKVLADRGYQGSWNIDDPKATIQAVEDLYFKDNAPEPVLRDDETQHAIWQRIKSTFHFQNLSVDSLAYVYENTLVTRETRRLFGIHSTPPEIAEYIVRRLPFDNLEVNEWRVFEPFSGHSVFLVAAMQRIRELLPRDMNSQQRHDYFVEMLSGIEIDDFAREVARLSLMLADYPNPDGWRLHRGDALKSPMFAHELSKANIVLCNPPFEAFSPSERAGYDDLYSVWKPAEILYRVLQNPPELLGFVLPRIFLKGQGYRELRSRLGNTYGSIELLALPDKVFQHSDAESVLLLCSGRNRHTKQLRTAGVYKWDHKDFYAIRPSYEFSSDVEDAEAVFAKGMWWPPLQEVWEATSKMKRLGEVSSIHRGIQYNVSLRTDRSILISDEDQDGFKPGLHRVKTAVEPYVVLNTLFLNVSPDLMETSAHMLPWHESKLIVNANQQSRGPWKVSASIDNSGLVCYQNFHGIWHTGTFPLEVLAAVLNGPLGNAFVGTRESKRHVHVHTLKDIPVPEINHGQEETIVSLVRQYSEARGLWLSGVAEEAKERCSRLLASIDAEVLKAYDLPPRVERILLDYFTGHVRLGPVDFTEYFPSTFRPFIPWHLYISEDFKAANAKDTLTRMPVIPESSLIDEALSYME